MFTLWIEIFTIQTLLECRFLIKWLSSKTEFCKRMTAVRALGYLPLNKTKQARAPQSLPRPAESATHCSAGVKEDFLHGFLLKDLTVVALEALKARRRKTIFFFWSWEWNLWFGQDLMSQLGWKEEGRWAQLRPARLSLSFLSVFLLQAAAEIFQI